MNYMHLNILLSFSYSQTIVIALFCSESFWAATSKHYIGNGTNFLCFAFLVHLSSVKHNLWNLQTKDMPPIACAYSIKKDSLKALVLETIWTIRRANLLLTQYLRTRPAFEPKNVKIYAVKWFNELFKSIFKQSGEFLESRECSHFYVWR